MTEPFRHLLQLGPPSAPRKAIDRQIAVVIGITDHRREDLSLVHPAHDAETVARLLADDYGFEPAISPGGALTDLAATREAIEEAVTSTLAAATPTTRWVFYFAGHGLAERTAGYLVPADGAASDLSSLVPVRSLVDRCLASPCAEALLILDNCYAGRALVRSDQVTDALAPPADGPRTGICQVLASGGPSDEVLDGGGEGHSIFTRCLLEALEGWAGIHFADGGIRLTPLLLHLRMELERRLGGLHSQTVVGGHLAPPTEPEDFCFRPRIARPSPETIAALRASEPSMRRRGLRDLVEECLEQPSMLPLALRFVSYPISLSSPAHGAPLDLAPDPDAEVRSAAAAVLADLARLWNEGPPVADPSRFTEPLVRLALEDPSAAVRHGARSALGRMDARLQVGVTARLLSNRSDQARRPRRRSTELLAALALARRRLPPGLRIVAPWVRLMVALDCAGRWIVATRLRRLGAVSPLGLLLGLYLALLPWFYFSPERDSRIAVRIGHPGFTFLPGIGRIVYVTDLTLRDLSDPRKVEEERQLGTWLHVEGGMPGWYDRLLDQVAPTLAAHTAWRLGRREECFRHLERGLANGDPSSVRLLGYLAFQSPDAVAPAVRMLVRALAERPALGRPVTDVLAVLADTRPEAVPDAVGLLRARLREASAVEREATLLEGLAAVSGRDPALRRIALAEVLATAERDAASRPALAEILTSLLAREPASAPTVLSALGRWSAETTGEQRLALIRVCAALPEGLDSTSSRLCDDLGDHLSDADPAIRAAALTALGTLLTRRPEEATSVRPRILTLALEDPRPEIRYSAASLLAALPAAIADAPRLAGTFSEMATTTDDPELRRMAIRELGELLAEHDLPPARSTLIALTGDSHGQTRAEALRALGRAAVARPREAPRILSLLQASFDDHDAGVRQELTWALLLLADHRPRALSAAARRLVEDAVADTSSLHGLKAFAAEFTLATPAAAETAAEAVALEMVGRSSSSDFPVYEFLSELGNHRPEATPRIISSLSRILAEEETPGQADRARVLIWQWRDLSAAQAAIAYQLLEAQTRSPRASERRAAVEVLGGILSHHGDLAVRKVDSLSPLLGDPSPEVRALTAWTLGTLALSQLATAADIERALTAGASATDPRTRTACARALARLSPHFELSSTTVGVLVTRLSDPDPQARSAAAAALAHQRNGAPALIRPMHRRLSREIDPEARLSLAAALGRIGGPAPGPSALALREIDRTLRGEDEQLRIEAIWALRDLGEGGSIWAEAAIERLGGLLEDERIDGRLVIIALRDIGLARPAAAARALPHLVPILETRDHPLQWDALINGIEPMVRAQPSTAAAALRAVHTHVVEMGATTQTADVAERTLLIAALRAPGPVSRAGSWLRSSSALERDLGARLALEIATDRPAAVPELLRQLDGAQRSPLPYHRASAAQAREMVTLLVRSRQLGAEEERLEAWERALGPVPDTGLREALEVVRREGREPRAAGTRRSDE